ncbi:MAG: hypothetical protein R3C49_16395 [Planctomycetaceae bacterium]
MVDTQGLMTPGSGLQNVNESWTGEASIPVLVKGWVVKRWDDRRPLIYCEALRLISPRPHIELIRSHTIDKRRLRPEENWLYYETLRQLEMTNSRLQVQLAGQTLKTRIDSLMVDVARKAQQDLKALERQGQNGKLTDEQRQRQTESIQRRLKQRTARYHEYHRRPEEFQTFVDLFQHPEAWHGELVTLRGHVRHAMSYPGDRMLFGGRTLHELWLFTDDSQNNPTVVVTPALPQDFPVGAEVVDRVTVTGCFFKRYVYSSQDVDRIAPLILAGGITWEPTVDQVQALVAEGAVPAAAPLAARARSMAKQASGDSAMVLASLILVVVLMIFWGQAQREERDRVRLRKVVNEVPVFENPMAGEPGSERFAYEDLLGSALTAGNDHRLYGDGYRTPGRNR